MQRTYSERFIPGMSDYDLFKNKNVDWISGPFTKVAYVIIVFLTWFIFHISEFFTAEDCWTVTNTVHGVITFVLFHWIKGCPDDSTQGEYNGFTLYEQLDAGTPWTSSKKFMMLIPSLITWMACHIANYKPFHVIINVCIFMICIIAKIPQMHRVRIFGINSTPGIDTVIEYSPEKKRQSEASNSKKD
jgi:hypothetical protein